jgi:hypothetical protein
MTTRIAGADLDTMAEAQALDGYGSSRRIGRRVAVALAVIVTIGVVAIAIDHLRSETPQQRAERVCIDKYNSFVKEAKANLAKGDRIAAINSLVAAKAQLHQCEISSASSVSGIMQ